MKVATIFFLLTGILTAKPAFASKVYTVNNGDWGNAFIWNTGQPPASPDTIIIKHYITFSQNLAIAAPSELIVENTGTLCGDFELDIHCGARLTNYGHIYVNSAKFRDTKNYNQISSKNSITISACNQPGYGTGFINYAPNGLTQVWPPVLCKTPGTNWENGSPTAFRDFYDGHGIRILQDPFSLNTWLISADKTIQVLILDLLGKEIWRRQNSDSYVMQTDAFPPGLYFIRITANNSQVTRRLITQ
ncbi:MAG: T9SS type A sorting domain-containing protein [Bacteroidota bacterium]